jgi:hypothetical protein
MYLFLHLFPLFLFCIFAIAQYDATFFTKLAFLLTVIFKFAFPGLILRAYTIFGHVSQFNYVISHF